MLAYFIVFDVLGGLLLLLGIICYAQCHSNDTETSSSTEIADAISSLQRTIDIIDQYETSIVNLEMPDGGLIENFVDKEACKIAIAALKQVEHSCEVGGACNNHESTDTIFQRKTPY